MIKNKYIKLSYIKLNYISCLFGSVHSLKKLILLGSLPSTFLILSWPLISFNKQAGDSTVQLP